MARDRPGHESAQAWLRHGWALAALAAFALYFPALKYGFTYDDITIVRDNPRIRDLSNPVAYLRTNWWGSKMDTLLYRPATMGSFALNYAVHGDSPLGYHFVNNALHALNAALLWLLAARLAGRERRGLIAALAAALLFAVHAVHVEAVAGIVGRAELLMSAGYLAALIAALRSIEAFTARARAFWCAAVFLASALSCFSKEHGVTLSAAVALLPLAVLPGGKPVSLGARWRPVLPALGAAAGAAACCLFVRMAVLGNMIKPAGMAIPVDDNPLVALDFIGARRGALAVLVHAASLLVLPLRPSINYGLRIYEARTVAQSLLWPAGLALLILMGIAIFAWRRRPAARIALLWLIVSYSIGSNLVVLIGTILAERLLYLPSAMACLLAGSALLADFSPGKRKGLIAGLVALGGCHVVLAAHYLPAWRDNSTLMRRAIESAPLSANIQTGYAIAMREEGNLEAALEHINRAVALSDNLKQFTWKGIIEAELGRPEALATLEKAHAYDQALDPLNKELARLLSERGESARAERVLVEGIRQQPYSIEARWLLALWLDSEGRHREADGAYSQIEGSLTESQQSEFARLRDLRPGAK